MTPGIPCHTYDREFHDEFEHLVPLNYYFLPIDLNMYPFNFIDLLFLCIKREQKEAIALPFLETSAKLIKKWALTRD